MEKMVITLIIEGTKEDLNTIKGNIINTASEAMVSLKADMLSQEKKLDFPSAVIKDHYSDAVKMALNSIYGTQCNKGK